MGEEGSVTAFFGSFARKKEEVVTPYRMYLEGIWDTLKAQGTEDYAGEIAQLLEDILWDLYREGFADGQFAELQYLKDKGMLKGEGG